MPHASHEEFLVLKDKWDRSCHHVDSSLQHLALITVWRNCCHLQSGIMHDFDSLRDQEDQVGGFAFAQLAEVIESARSEEHSEVTRHLEEHVDFLLMLERDLSLHEASDLFLEL